MSFMFLHRLKPFVARSGVRYGLRGNHFSAPRALSLEPVSAVDAAHELQRPWSSGQKVTNNADGTRLIQKKLKGGGTIEVIKTPGQPFDMTTLIYPDEGKYVGQWKDNKKNGLGTHTYSLGGSYKGEYKDGRENGQGVKTHPNGSILKGEFRQGRIHNGRGTLVTGEGRRMEGEWIDGRLDGVGRVETKNGIVFEWEMKEGVETGLGTQRFPDGTLYEGHWADLKTLGLSRFTEMRRHGPGKLTTARKQVLQGVWKEGTFLEGHGTMVLPQGEILEGTWVDGKMEGPGKFFSQLQNVTYVGDFQRGLKHGLGILSFKNGAKYVGEFAQGKKHGQGRYTSRNGEVLEGLWESDDFRGASSTSADDSIEKNEKEGKKTDHGTYDGELSDGKPHGHGTFTSNTTSYVGLWHKGKRSGAGRETSAHGTVEGEFRFDKIFNGSGVALLRNEVCQGTWVDGKMQGQGEKRDLHRRSHYRGELRDGRMQGQGTMSYSNGTTYVGAFEDNKQHGEGRLIDADGTVLYFGEWRTNRRHGCGSILKASVLPQKRRERSDAAAEGDEQDQQGEERIEGVWEDGKFLREEPLPDRLRASPFMPAFSIKPAVMKEKKDKETAEAQNSEIPLHQVAGAKKLRERERTKENEGDCAEKTDKKNKNLIQEATEETLRYPDGSTYTGGVLHGARHGHGTFTTADGLTSYTGAWKKDKRCGQGITTCPRGECSGEYRNDRIFRGAGLLVLSNGDVHEGTWEQGLLQGYGVRTEPKRKSVYSGHFERGRKHGQGVLAILNGDTYTGAFERGFRHGHGVCVGADGRTYTGEWVKGYRHGYGKLTTSRGWTEGEFREDKIFHGTGEVFAAKLGVNIKRVWVSGVLQKEEHSEHEE